MFSNFLNSPHRQVDTLVAGKSRGREFETREVLKNFVTIVINIFIIVFTIISNKFLLLIKIVILINY